MTTMPPTAAHIRDTILRLLDGRDAASTICPSEVARVLAPEAWRPLMAPVRAVAAELAREGRVEIRQGGAPVAPAGPWRGPIRIGRAVPPQASDEAPTTPDGRYLVVRGRLWRKANPALSEHVRQALVKELMAARRALRGQRSEDARKAARERVDELKRALGERGPVWWDDGAPDFNRRMVRNTPYAAWFEALPT